MIHGTKKYVCLAEYRCSCIPPGKPVSERTMKKHRKAANQRRALLGKNPLSSGPRYTDASSAAVFSRYLRIRDAVSTCLQESEQNQAVDHVSPGFPETTYSRDDGSRQTLSGSAPDMGMGSELRENPVDDNILQFDEHEVGEDMVIPTHQSMEFAIAQLETGETSGDHQAVEEDRNVSSSQGEASSPEDVITDAPQTRTSVEEQTTLSQSDGVDAHEDDSNVDGTAGDTDERRFGNVQIDAEIRFHEWMNKEREWIDLFMKFGVNLSLMDAIMKLLGAPFGAIQLRRNLEKYTSYHSIRYVSCRGHMLIKGVDNAPAADPSSPAQCEVCSASGTEPDFITFEYLPIIPRLQAWVSNEESCRLLYESFHRRCNEFDQAQRSGKAGSLFQDFTDGELFKKIVDDSGGIQSVKFDVFIAPSCDGFEPFMKGKYSCWPLVALNHNLPASHRFLMKNVIPLGMIQGPAEPKEVHTWFRPLKEEIYQINANGGTLLRFFDGVERRVRVHIMFATGDDPAVCKMAGLMGHNSKNPCRYCNLVGIWSPFHSHVYFPSVCKVLRSANSSGSMLRIPNGSENERTETKRIYDPFSPPMRNQDEIEIALRSLDDDSRLSTREKKSITDGCGLKKRTVLLNVHSIFPYASFPVDIMHKFMNICHDMFVIFKGDCVHLSPSNLKSDDTFVLSRDQWNRFDAEIKNIKMGTSASVFPDVPRSSQHASHWKAIECIEFLANYAMILLEGRLPKKYMKNLRILCKIVELCRRPLLTREDVDNLKQLGPEFVVGFEDLYYRKDPRRVGVCKSTLHSLVHLGWAVEQCGPPLYYSQFWVERYVGNIKGRLHATAKAAESLNENSKVGVRVNLYYGKHFFGESSDTEHGETSSDSTTNGVILLAPVDKESTHGPYHRSKRTTELLRRFIQKAEDMSFDEAKNAVSDGHVWCYGRARIRCGDGWQTVGARDARRHRKNMKRSDFYVSAEFLSEEQDTERIVYYGRVLKFLRFTFDLQSIRKEYELVMTDWCMSLHADRWGQAYSPKKLDKVFSNVSIEDASVIFRGVGVLEHRSPSFQGTRTYFIDPSRDICELLDSNKADIDGINRCLVSV